MQMKMGSSVSKCATGSFRGWEVLPFLPLTKHARWVPKSLHLCVFNGLSGLCFVHSQCLSWVLAKFFRIHTALFRCNNLTVPGASAVPAGCISESNSTSAEWSAGWVRVRNHLLVPGWSATKVHGDPCMRGCFILPEHTASDGGCRWAGSECCF